MNSPNRHLLSNAQESFVYSNTRRRMSESEIVIVAGPVIAADRCNVQLPNGGQTFALRASGRVAMASGRHRRG